MGEIRPKRCEGRELTKDQLAVHQVRQRLAGHTRRPAVGTVAGLRPRGGFGRDRGGAVLLRSAA